MSSTLNFYQFYCNLKEKDHIRRKINSFEINIIILTCRKLGSIGPVQQKL